MLAIAQFIRAQTHLDIGTDHAFIPLYLLATGRVERILAVENNQDPYQTACKALMGKPAEVRFGDGLEPVTAGEFESLSISGMGWRSILSILSAHPDRLPDRMVLQANDGGERIREWARQSGFHLKDEKMAPGFWLYEILHFQKDEGPDPAYTGLPRQIALRYGPHLLRRRDGYLRQRLEQDRDFFRKLSDKPGVDQRYRLIVEALKLLD